MCIMTPLSGPYLVLTTLVLYLCTTKAAPVFSTNITTIITHIAQKNAWTELKCLDRPTGTRMTSPEMTFMCLHSKWHIESSRCYRDMSSSLGCRKLFLLNRTVHVSVYFKISYQQVPVRRQRFSACRPKAGCQSGIPFSHYRFLTETL